MISDSWDLVRGKWLKSSRIPWVFWAFACIVTLCIIVPGLHLWPRITQDEVQIIDLGRVILNPDTDWSTGWLVHQSHPMHTLFYLGSVVQELSYLAFSPTNFGARFSALIAAVLAASLAFGWLQSRGTPALGALVISWALLLDPLFNESYRQGRIDSLAFAVCFGACWLLNHAIAQSSCGRNPAKHLFWAGVLAGTAVFIWPTALSLMPLVVLELFYLLRSLWRDEADNKLRTVFLELMWFAMGGLASVIVFLVPVLLSWDAQLSSLGPGIHIQKIASAIQRSVVDMFFLYDRMIIPIVVVSLLIRREIGLIIASGIALLMMYQTMVYPMRILYLVPYVAVMVAGAYSRLARDENAPRQKVVLYSCLGLLLSWNISVSLVKRPVLAKAQADASSVQQIQDALQERIGEGSFRVLTTEWDVYYAARAMGWKTYKLFGRVFKSKEEFKVFLGSMDYAISRDRFAFSKAVSSDDLLGSGFEPMEPASFIQPISTEVYFGPFTFRGADTVYHDLNVFKNTALIKNGIESK